MTHAIRNFYIEAYIDGRKTRLSGGPRTKDGGMSISVLMRDDGGIADAVDIECVATPDGTLTTIVTMGTQTITKCTHR
jgi:hypothetical protein